MSSIIHEKITRFFFWMKIIKKQDHAQKEEQSSSEQPKNFFRELEIEFLLHELKDPIAVIETGVRTLLEKREKFGSLTPRQEITLKRILRKSIKTKK